VNSDLGDVSSQLAQIESQKATKTEVAVERARINSFTTLAEGSTTGDAELIDVRVGADGETYVNAGEAIRTQFNGIKNTLYNQSTEYQVIDSANYTILDFSISCTNLVDELYTTFLLESSADDKVAIVDVTSGEKYKITGSAFGGIYIGAMFVFASVTDIPSVGTQISQINNGSFDIYAGVTASKWTYVGDYEVTVPDGAVKMYVRRHGGINPVIKKQVTVNESKIPTVTSKLINDSLQKKTIFPITVTPTVTTGTVTAELYKTRRSNQAFKWDFNTVGSITYSSVEFVSETNDVVGVWVYVNYNMLNYNDNYDGVVEIYIDDVLNKQIFVAYSLHSGWNYLILSNISAGKHNVSLKFNFTLVRNDYTLIVDSVELNYKNKPHVLFSFDMFGLDGFNVRYPLLKQRGFRATFCNPIDLSDTQIAELLMQGWDWSLYGGIGTRPDYVTGTVEEWKNYLQANIDAHSSRGLFNPIAYFSPTNRGSQLLMDAEKAVGYRMSRIACSGNNYMEYFTHDGFFIYTFGIGGTTTAQQVIDVLNQAITTGTTVCFFTHRVQDTLTDNMHCLRSVFESVLDAIKAAVDAGKCDVITFREFYQLCEPSDYENYMHQRREKEKNYILSKII
ncbi:MAG: hypothetical protein PHX08_25500, partial [Lachnospiraceae bacterium]|nr:hypothetical protein [Lachnospiraceae bacterium]